MQRNLEKKFNILNHAILTSIKNSKEQDIVKNFTHVTIKILGANYGFSFFKDNGSDKFFLAYKHPRTPFEPTLPRKNGITHEAFLKKVPIYETDYNKSAWVIGKLAPFIKGFVSIPITYQNKNYGTFNICYRQSHKFSKEEKNLCVLIGNSTAQAITIHRLVNSERGARREAEYQKQRFQSLIENSYDAIILIDPKGQIKYASPSAQKISGYSPADLEGHNITEFIYKDDLPQVARDIQYILSHPKTSYVSEFRYRHKNGRLGWLESTGVNMLNNKSVQSIVSNVRDVTEKKKIQQQEKALIRQREEFFNIASHELKTPVTVIKGFTQLLEGDLKTGKSTPRTQNYISKISYNIGKMNRLVADFLDISGINAGKLKFKTGEFELNSFLRDKIKDLKMAVPGHKLVLSPIKGKFHINGDMERIGQVLNNLVTNAAKYSPEGTKILVRLSSLDPSHVKLEVEDFGMGIPEKYRNKIFKRFFQAKKHAGVYQGLGLGLYISSLIVHHHGGILNFFSKDKGTIFYFTLPYSHESKKK